MCFAINTEITTHTHTHTQVLGQPHSDVCGKMIEECKEMRDSLLDFEAWNSGRNVTNPSKVHS